MDLVKGKVAAIKSNYAIIINKGSEDGVEENMIFVVYEEGEDIIDPDTSKSLGKLEYVKTKVRIVYPSEKYSLAETYETYTVSPMSSILSSLGNRFERVKLPLAEDVSLSGEEINPNVQVGDLVKQIIG